MNIQKPAGTDRERELERQAVARLASNVVNEAHWQQVLASAETDEQRAELERVVGPMLPFRRAAACTTPGCVSGKHGIWQPVLVVLAPQALDAPVHVPIELRLCDACKAEATLDDFLTDGIWLQVLSVWPGTDWPPVRRLTTLQWDRVH